MKNLQFLQLYRPKVIGRSRIQERDQDNIAECVILSRQILNIFTRVFFKNETYVVMKEKTFEHIRFLKLFSHFFR